MSFWDTVKEFFGLGPEGRFDNEVWDAMVVRMDAGKSFSPIDIADAATSSVPSRSMDDLNDALRSVEAAFDAGKLEPHGYTRSMRKTSAGMDWVYHLADESKARAKSGSARVEASPPSRTASSAGLAPSPVPQQPAQPRSDRNPYEAGSILKLSAKEMRARALKIQPWKTAWIGRVDTIPPQSDERTALIDRGVILRGLLTEDQVREIHRVGDLWIEHHDTARLIGALASKSADEAVQRIREEAGRAKAERKQRAANKKQERAEQIARRHDEDILYLGPGVSTKLSDRRCHVEGLQAKGLPVLASPADVARAIGISVPELRWLCFHNEAAKHTHYVQFEIPKRSGGMRLLAAPMPKLAAAQSWVFENILSKLPVDLHAHGFVRGRSTVTNARPHQGREIVINLDLQDFFPTITFPRVRGVFVKLGYSPAVATILALLCTESPRRTMTYDGRDYHVAVGERGLPQGACTSPALSNQVAYRLDRRLQGLAHKHGFHYTRYADDLTFSTSSGRRVSVPFFQARVRHVIQDEGFAVQLKKGRVQRAAGRQTVTGIVVNDGNKLGLPREEVRRLRAILHNAKKTGLAAQNRDAHPDFVAVLRGKIAYLAMIDPQRAAQLREELARLA